MTDAAIIDLYWQRSELAIEATGRTYGGYCYAVADRILNDPEDSEECVSDTWLAAWNSIPPQRPSPLRVYLGALTRRISLSRLRARLADKRGGGEAVLVLEELAECVPAARDTEQTVAERALVSALNAFLKGLGEEERRLFVARYWHNYPVAELAEAFALKPSTVTTRLSRTRSKLRRYLEKEGLL